MGGVTEGAAGRNPLTIDNDNGISTEKHLWPQELREAPVWQLFSLRECQTTKLPNCL